MVVVVVRVATQISLVVVAAVVVDIQSPQTSQSAALRFRMRLVLLARRGLVLPLAALVATLISTGQAMALLRLPRRAAVVT